MNYALLVGINKYHKKSGVSNLDGCTNDVARVKSYLEERFGDDIRIKTLLDDGRKEGDGPATRAFIIQQFLQHLGQARAGELAIFQFSGHGSTEIAPDEIRASQGSKINETLVCQDSRVGNTYDLADIELKYLISEVAKNGAEVVVILDSCFAGSANRYASNYRTTGASKKQRPLNTYLEEARSPIADPRHILLAGCKKDQLAAEYVLKKKIFSSVTYGLFTHSLMSILEKLEQPIPYNRLMSECSSLMVKNMGNSPFSSQTPVLDTSAHFYPFNNFLDVRNHFDKYYWFNLRNIKGQWIIDFGFVNGFPFSSKATAKFVIFGDHSTKQPIAEIETEQVYLGYSVIKVSGELESLDPTKAYIAIPIDLPEKLLSIHLSGNKISFANDLADLSPADQLKVDALFSFETKTEQTSLYELSVKPLQYILQYQDTKQPLLDEGFERYEHTDPKRNPTSNIKQLSILLEHLSRWEYLYQLDMPLKDSSIGKSIQQLPFNFGVVNEKGEFISFPSKPSGSITEITLDYTEKWINPAIGLIEYSFRARNTYNDTLYFYLLHLSRTYEIETYFHEEVAEDSHEINLLKKERFGLGLPEGSNQVTDTFKLIISKEELPYFHPEQPPMKKLFKEIRQKRRDAFRITEIRTDKKDTSNWFTQTISIKLLRQLGQISEEDLTIANGQITIKGHSEFRAGVSLASSARKMRSPDVDFIIADWANKKGIELLDFSGSNQKETILELHHMENNKVLPLDPLVIMINTLYLSEDEILIPLTLPGNMPENTVVPELIEFGHTEKLSDGKIKITINQIPNNPDDGRPEKGKSLKISFYKYTKNP